MIKNYFTITIRNIQRNLSYSVINVFGLALGITCSLVLFLMISFSTSFDNFHENGDRIYRLVMSSNLNGRQNFGAGVPAPLPDAVRTDFSGIEHVLFISGSHDGLFTIEENGSKKIFEEEEGFGYTDSTYFTFFNRHLIEGNYKTALADPNQAVISRKTAKRFFADQNALGQVMRLDNKLDLKVTGILDDFPNNTNFPFDILISYATIKKQKDEQGWSSTYSDDQCYVMLEAVVNPEIIDKQFPAFIEKYQGKETAEEMKRWLQPLSELNYDTRFSNYRYRTVSKSSIMAMGMVAVFLLITACINFINLSTAVAVKRSKEVGIRKVLGSQRLQLIGQYLAETALITLIALVVSIGLSELTLIKLNSFLDLNLHVNIRETSTLLYLVIVWLVVSTLSGSYPAMLLSGFSPALALKNKITNRSTGGFALRRGLVVFQFVISQFLIVGTVILLTQMNFLQSKDLGFAKEAIISVPIPNHAPTNNMKVLKSELSRMNGVDRTSLCSALPSSGSVSMTNFRIEGIDDNHVTQVKLADEDYVGLFEIDLMAGSNLIGLDTATTCLVNEQLMKTAGFEKPEDIVGRVISIWGSKLPVAGVVKDFHTMSLESQIDPTIIFTRADLYHRIAVRLKAGSFNETISQIEKAWTTQYPEYLFSYDFLDDQIREFYESEHKMSVLLVIFSSIAITIGCLGLYGLISFMAHEKEKEIGVRKVLGASTFNILFIFSKEFMILIIVAFVIASPLAGYIMSQWLDNFAYKTPLSGTMFIAGIVITLLIAFITVGYRSIKASMSNPVEALRNE